MIAQQLTPIRREAPEEKGNGGAYDEREERGGAERAGDRRANRRGLPAPGASVGGYAGVFRMSGGVGGGSVSGGGAARGPGSGIHGSEGGVLLSAYFDEAGGGTSVTRGGGVRVGGGAVHPAAVGTVGGAPLGVSVVQPHYPPQGERHVQPPYDGRRMMTMPQSMHLDQQDHGMQQQPQQSPGSGASGGAMMPPPQIMMMLGGVGDDGWDMSTVGPGGF